jgi:hypothetical protein
VAGLKFYEVDRDYIVYLAQFDSRVPRIDYSKDGRYDKFMCGIVLSVNNNDYFAPISSFKTPQVTNLLIKYEPDRILGSIRFSFMIPVPTAAVTLKDITNEPNVRYKRLLNMELQYCNKHSGIIYTTAKFVYEAVTNQKEEFRYFTTFCCNFKLLEEKCIEYAKAHGLEVRSPESPVAPSAPEQLKAQDKKPLCERAAEATVRAKELNASITKPHNDRTAPER